MRVSPTPRPRSPITGEVCFAWAECAAVGRDGKRASLYEQGAHLWDETVSPGEDAERPRGVSSLLSRFQVRDTPELA